MLLILLVHIYLKALLEIKAINLKCKEKLNNILYGFFEYRIWKDLLGVTFTLLLFFSF